MERTIFIIVAFLFITNSFANAGNIMMSLDGVLLFSSLGFYCLSAADAIDITNENKNLYNAGAVLSFGLALGSIYKGLFSNDEMPPNINPPRSTIMKILPILSGSYFMYISLTNNPGNNLTEDGKYYYNTGKYCMATFGFLQLLTGIIGPPKFSDLSFNKNDASIISPVVMNDYLGLTIAKVF